MPAGPYDLESGSEMTNHVLKAETGRHEMKGGQATLSVRAYLSLHHLWAAEHFANMTEETEAALVSGSTPFDPEHRSYAFGAILESTAFLEAVINEQLQDAADGHGGKLPGAAAGWAALWEESDEGYMPLLAKYQLALVAAGKEPLDRGAEPFQSVRLLIELRNLITHFRPQSVRAGEAMKIEKKIGTRFATTRAPIGDGNPWFPDRCLGAGCAQWAVRVAKEFADAFHERLGVRGAYQDRNEMVWYHRPVIR